MKKILFSLIALPFSLFLYGQNITFEDKEVKRICIANWDTNGDGELSKSEAATVRNVGSKFSGNTKIKTFNELQYFTGLTAIVDYAFTECSNLSAITIPNSVTSIGDYAFISCSSLSAITIPNSVTKLGIGTFYECSALTDVNIGSGVTNIGSWVFSACLSLSTITIPQSVVSIGKEAFYDCSGLTDITIGSGVTDIGSGAFFNCSSLTAITIPQSVASIGDGAFSRCSGLTSMTVAPGNTVYDARNDCNAIIETSSHTLIAGCKSTIIPISVTSIGDYAFTGCSDLTTFTIPNNVTSIGNYAFAACSNLTTITFGCGVTDIGEEAFSHCKSLTAVTIPNSVASIGDYAFEGCSDLTSVTIGSGVTSIGDMAFYNCSNLTDIYCKIVDPFPIEKSVFCYEYEYYDEEDNENYLGFQYLYDLTTLYVPSGSLKKYQITDAWCIFSNIVEKEFDQPARLFAHAEASNMRMGGLFDVAVGFFNGIGTYNGYQFDLSLPEGFRLQEKNGSYSYELSERFNADGMSVSISKNINDSYRVLVYSTTDACIRETDGELIRLVAVADKDMEAGEYAGCVYSAMLSKSNGENIDVEPGPFFLVIPEYELGDVNNDNVVDVTDVMLVVNHILGNTLSFFQGAYADMNGDGIIDVTDIMLIVSVILDSERM